MLIIRSLFCQVKEHQGEDVIYIDMAKLNENWEYHSGTFAVESLK